MNINTDIDDFHMGFLPLRLVGLGDSQNRKMAFRTVCRSAIFPVWCYEKNYGWENINS